jgi:hypothetical protein
LDDLDGDDEDVQEACREANVDNLKGLQEWVSERRKLLQTYITEKDSEVRAEDKHLEDLLAALKLLGMKL